MKYIRVKCTGSSSTRSEENESEVHRVKCIESSSTQSEVHQSEVHQSEVHRVK